MEFKEMVPTTHECGHGSTKHIIIIEIRYPDEDWDADVEDTHSINCGYDYILFSLVGHVKKNHQFLTLKEAKERQRTKSIDALSFFYPLASLLHGQHHHHHHRPGHYHLSTGKAINYVKILFDEHLKIQLLRSWFFVRNRILVTLQTKFSSSNKICVHLLNISAAARRRKESESCQSVTNPVVRYITPF